MYDSSAPRVEHGTSAIPTRSSKRLAQLVREIGLDPDYWYPVILSRDLQKKPVEVTFWGQDIALYRSCAGTIHALENRCPHRHIKLSEGTVEQENIVCPYHGWTFSGCGKLIEIKHETFGRKLPVLCVRSFPVRERYGLVWIFPGHAAFADATPLPHIPHAEGEDRWANLAIERTWHAHHSIIIDNFSNLTHLWLHRAWTPYTNDHAHLAEYSIDGDRICATWHHRLKKDLVYPIITGPLYRVGEDDAFSETKVVFDYPYHATLTGQRVRTCVFLSPIDREHTRVFTLQYWKSLRMPLTNNPYPWWIARLGMPIFKRLTSIVIDQDRAMVESEQRLRVLDGRRPTPELNPMVKQFNQILVQKWEAHLRRRKSRTGCASTAQPHRAAKIL